ncbi:glycoside hydrolase family 3 C-terminal domain-containing protein [Allomuricauda sp. SCSIO 65647]|uniref:glycoside hydrolase family 3 C-terminal domain-containing protein n=1 Tax=Allomuricauda sp. SCSIO 65647 TaxID=2908843 RepID=UPI001F211DBB|nr:glycoside hydrolase family 3 N-terminal domain-containing protein [Muricauda sp. SCSIO 65647]UJH66437.1 glycoside hydrolase family 3 C-terminal domain-containing protein [Muricauda sp. SCSIO 65647]
MKKKLVLVLKILGILLLLAGLAAFFGYRYVKATFFSFEEDYIEVTDFKELTVDGHTFMDRNANGTLDVYEDDRQSLEARVADALSQMTLEEKIHLLKGSGIASAMGQGEPGGIPGAVGTIVPTPRLGIPTVYLSDGPAGLRILPIREGEDRTHYCTAFPIATSLASTWNEDLVYEVGNAMGNEALEYGIDVILGPGANIHRHPLCGRNFEYFSEDPLLSGYMGAAIVNGIESNGIGTSVKHFVANNQETERFVNDVIVSERAMREIYLKGFEHIVKKSQPWTIMSSYNRINGTPASENPYVLTDVLRGEWGFQGLVMTDWFGGENPPAQIAAGNDLLEPGTKRQWKALAKAAENGELSEADIDRAAGRILTLIFKTKKMQRHALGNDPDLEAHAKITRNSAAEGMVLLKNDGTLPLTNIKNVALLGVTSYEFIAGGTGSGDVNEAYTVSLEEGLANAGFEINKAGKEAFDAHKSANIEGFKRPEGIEAIFSPFTPPEMSYSKEQLNKIASSSDVGILTLGRNAGEGGDRVEKDDFLLTDVEQEMIRNITEAFHAVGKKLIVVMNIGGVVETASWKDKPDAILLAWQGGQEGGNSVADILSGKVNPSGKLPMTFPVNLADHASHTNFPKNPEMMSIRGMMMNRFFPPKEKPEAEKVRDEDYTHYDEGIYVGYRHFDKEGVNVSYPFGHGLSYAAFEYGDMELDVENDTIGIAMTLKNVGKVPGKEVVQVYAEKLSSEIDRPIQELRAFAKTALLHPEVVDSLFIQIPVKDLQFWDENANGWRLERGTYAIKVAASSRDIRQVGEIEL